MKKIRFLAIMFSLLLPAIESSAQLLLDYATGATTVSTEIPVPVRDVVAFM